MFIVGQCFVPTLEVNPILYRFYPIVLCACCSAIGIHHTIVLDGTEFGFGRITGVLLQLNEVGALAFIVGLWLWATQRQYRVPTTLAAAILSLPLYALLVAPGLMQSVFGGVWSYENPPVFVWTTYSMVGITANLMVCLLSMRSAFELKD